MPLLQQLPSGTYRIECSSLDNEEGQIIHWLKRGWINEVGLSTYYPFGNAVLVATQPEDTLNANHVFHFVDQISQGLRPFVITLKTISAECEFVLDGHHKLCAYDMLNISPWRLCIIAPDSKMTPDDWPQTFQRPNSWMEYWDAQERL